MSALDLLLMFGATYRLVVLVQGDLIARPVRLLVRPFLRRLKLDPLLSCPWCLSPYVGALVFAGWYRFGDRVWFTGVLAVATISAFVGSIAVMTGDTVSGDPEDD